MKIINPEELTPRQKLGMAMIAFVDEKAENLDFILERIEKHSLGGVWVNPTVENHAEVMRKIHSTADYPILVFCDAESGIGEYLIGKHNALGCAGSEELAYIFGKVTAVTARNMGYTVICDPVLDLNDENCTCGAATRSLGQDKVKVTRLAAAEARGLHDGGVLTVGKHYPGKATEDKIIDSHMAESKSYASLEELLDYNLYPYIELMKEGLLDGIMTKHTRYMNVDPVYPASLSEKMIGLYRERGFDGFSMTDALIMMGVVARFGKRNSIGLAVANGNDIALPYTSDNRFAYEALCACYDEGMIADSRLDEAVRRVVRAQEKTAAAPKYTALTPEDIALFAKINSDSVYRRTDDGVPAVLPVSGKHLFVILTETVLDLDDRGKIALDTFSGEWYRPFDIAARLKELYPESGVTSISQFPSPSEVSHILNGALNFEDVVFITFFNGRPNIGIECLTSRIISLMNALQATERISTIVHIGNPYVLEDVPHIPRILIAPTSADSVMSALDVLAGKYPAKGQLTYKLNLK